MLRHLSGIVRYLIHTNLYIALAAVCFQLVIVVLVDRLDSWNWMLSLHTFGSTLLVYQFSRLHFYKQVQDPEFAGHRRDELYHWLDRHPHYTKISAVAGAVIAGVTLMFLEFQTIMILGVLGLISVIYPVRVRIGERRFSLRAVPFTKIFQISLVWAGISVWVPLSELGYPPFEHLDRFAFHFLFIFFITLPFDLVDISTDAVTRVKTIPGALGVRNTKLLLVASGLLLILYESLRMFYVGPFVIDYLSAYILLIATLGFYALTLDETSAKWKVMAVFDGSMIVLFAITFLLHKVS